MPFYVPFVLFAVVFVLGLKYPPLTIRRPLLVWALLVLVPLSVWAWLAYSPNTP